MSTIKFETSHVYIKPGNLNLGDIVNNDIGKLQDIANEIKSTIERNGHILYDGMELYKGIYNNNEYILYSQLSGKFYTDDKENPEVNSSSFSIDLKLIKNETDNIYISVNKQLKFSANKNIVITRFVIPGDFTYQESIDKNSLIIYSKNNPFIQKRKIQICKDKIDENKEILELSNIVNTQEDYQGIFIVIVIAIPFLVYVLCGGIGNSSIFTFNKFLIYVGNLLFFMSAYSIVDMMYYRYHENNFSIKWKKLLYTLIPLLIGCFLAFRSVSGTTPLDTFLSALFGVAGTYLARYFELYKLKQKNPPIMTYPQALQQLQYWLTNNQASHANHLNFNAHPLSAAELQAIREYTQNKLPESYYLFLQQCGTGDFFYSWYTSVIDQTASQMPKIEIYNLAQLKEQNLYYQQLLREELDNLPPDEHPDIGEIFIIGAHHSMGDWFGFDLSRAEPNFDIFIHDAANPATYAEEAQWRRFEDWIIRCVESEGEDTL